MPDALRSRVKFLLPVALWICRGPFSVPMRMISDMGAPGSVQDESVWSLTPGLLDPEVWRSGPPGALSTIQELSGPAALHFLPDLRWHARVLLCLKTCSSCVLRLVFEPRHSRPSFRRTRRSRVRSAAPGNASGAEAAIGVDGSSRPTDTCHTRAALTSDRWRLQPAIQGLRVYLLATDLRLQGRDSSRSLPRGGDENERTEQP